MRSSIPATSAISAVPRATRSVAPPRASWLTPGRREDGALPSWLAPPMPPEPALTSWAAPPPPPQSLDRMLRQSVLPRISVMPDADPDRPPMDSAVPPPPSLPLEAAKQLVAEELAKIAPLVEELRQGLGEARGSLERARRDALVESEQELVRLALAIAERVVGREIAMDPKVVALWAREGLESLGAEDNVRCLVSPRMGEVLMSLEHWYGDAPMPDVVVDSRLSGLSCEIRGRYGRVDAGLKARLDAVAASLGEVEDEL